MRKDKRPNGVNPPHNIVRHEDPALAKLRLYWDHKRADTLELYYLQYPEERPAHDNPRPKSRGR